MEIIVGEENWSARTGKLYKCCMLRSAALPQLPSPAAAQPPLSPGLQTDPVRRFFSTGTCLCHAGTWSLASCVPAVCVNQRCAQECTGL